MENEKLLNNILLIILLLLVANYISNGTVLEVLKRYYEKFLNTIQNTKNTENTENTKNIKKINNTKNTSNNKINFKEDPNIKKLYHFLQSLITVNNTYTELDNSKNKLISMSENDKETLNKFIIKSFNSYDFKFNNLVILDSIIFLENSAGKELKPFRISGDVYINKEPIAKITLHLEIFIRSDSTFYGPFNSGFPTFTRIKLIRKDKIATPISEIPNINDYEELVATDNSLIPDSINFSTDETGTGTGTEYSE
jgi:anion-transporting  ArsA/GET3 family ATPase